MYHKTKTNKKGAKTRAGLNPTDEAELLYEVEKLYMDTCISMEDGTAKKQSKYKSMTKEIKMHKEINNIKMLLFIDL